MSLSSTVVLTTTSSTQASTFFLIWVFKNFWIAFWYVAQVFFRPKVMTL
jgi:hypothetical protein